MLFGRKGKQVRDGNFSIGINGVNIERVCYTKFLGCYVDDELNWKYHTAQISSKISKNLGVLNKVKCIVPNSLLRTLYFTMVHPYLTYCNIIWGNASLIALQKLTILQKRAVCIICRAKFLAATSPLFKKQYILKLFDINKLQMAIFV